MKFRYILLGFFFFSFFHLSFSQEKCGSYDGALQHQIHKFPDFYESLKDKFDTFAGGHLLFPYPKSYNQIL